MTDLQTITKRLDDQGVYSRTARNPLAQFGTKDRQLLGAQLVPDRNREVYENSFDDEEFELRSIVGRDTTRYAPVKKQSKIRQKKKHVVLGELDSGSMINASQIDALNRTLSRRGESVTEEKLANMVDDVATGGLNDKKEVQRWEALVYAKIGYRGEDGIEEELQLEDPAGHRFDANGLWSDDSYDPFEDLSELYLLLEEAGHPLRAMFCRGKIWALLQKNATVAKKTGTLVVTDSLQLQSRTSLVSRNKIQLYLQSEGFPPFTVYNLDYDLPKGKGHFLRDDVVVGVGSTPKKYELTNEADGSELLINNILGHFEIGTAAAQDSVGPVVNAEYIKKKPAHIDVEAFLTGITNIQVPEAIGVIRNIQ